MSKSSAPEISGTEIPGTALQGFYEKEETPLRSGPDRIRRQLRTLRTITGAATDPMLILDLGCGDGAATAEIAAAARGHRVVGADWSLTALEQARARGLEVVRANLDPPSIPFEDGSADIVVMSEIIEHLVDTDAAVGAAHRLLRPGGHLLLSTPNLAAWFNRILLLAGVQPIYSEVGFSGIYGRPGSEVAGHLRMFTKRALTGFLLANGFTDIRVTGAAFEAVPRAGRPLDRLLTRVPDAAAILLVHARRPA